MMNNRLFIMPGAVIVIAYCFLLFSNKCHASSLRLNENNSRSSSIFHGSDDSSLENNVNYQRILSSLTLTGNWTMLGSTLDGKSPDAKCGAATALSNDGNIIAIGSYKDDHDGYTSGGVAYGSGSIYKWNGTDWDQLGDTIYGYNSFDHLGYSAAISSSGQIVAFGTSRYTNTNYKQGYVFVLQWNNNHNRWDRLGGDISTPSPCCVDNNYFGENIDLSDDGLTIIIAASGEDNEAGSVFTYKYNNSGSTSQWVLVDRLDGNDPGGEFGSSISLSGDGNVLVIGQSGYDSTTSSDIGRVIIYKWDTINHSWIELQFFDGEYPYDEFGKHVELSNDGKVLAIAQHFDVNNNPTSTVKRDGKVKFFDWNITDGKYNERGIGSGVVNNAEIIGNNRDYVGVTISFSNDGSIVAISQRDHSYTGAVKIYKWDNNNNNNNGGYWNEIGSGVGDYITSFFGKGLSLSGNGKIIAIGQPGVNWNSDRGSVKIYGIEPPTTPSPSPAPSTTPTNGAKGDPHFTTWIGKKYDFHGVCDLVLLQNRHFKHGLGMDIHIRTKKTRSWSYISSGVIRIGDDTLEVMGGRDKNMYWINKIQGENHPGQDEKILGKTTLGGYPVRFRYINNKAKEFIVDLGNGQSIHIKTWNAMVSININGGTKEDFGRSLGLMGTYENGLMMGRNNQTTFSNNLNGFGLEWQVQVDEPKLFHNIEGPQSPAKCEIPSNIEMRRRLGQSQISKSDAMIACSQVNDVDFDLCIFDVMATNSVDVARAY